MTMGEYLKTTRVSHLGKWAISKINEKRGGRITSRQ